MLVDDFKAVDQALKNLSQGLLALAAKAPDQKGEFAKKFKGWGLEAEQLAASVEAADKIACANLASVKDLEARERELKRQLENEGSLRMALQRERDGLSRDLDAVRVARDNYMRDAGHLREVSARVNDLEQVRRGLEIRVADLEKKNVELRDAFPHTHELINIRGELAEAKQFLAAGQKRESDLNKRAGLLEQEGIDLRRRLRAYTDKGAVIMNTPEVQLIESLEKRRRDGDERASNAEARARKLEAEVIAMSAEKTAREPLLASARAVLELLKGEGGKPVHLRAELRGTSFVTFRAYPDLAEEEKTFARIGRRLTTLLDKADGRDEVLLLRRDDDGGVTALLGPQGRIPWPGLGAPIGDGVRLVVSGKNVQEVAAIARDAFQGIIPKRLQAAMEKTLAADPTFVEELEKAVRGPDFSATITKFVNRSSCNYKAIGEGKSFPQDAETEKNALLIARGTCACTDCASWRRSHGITERRPVTFRDLAELAEKRNPSGPCVACGKARKVVAADSMGYRLGCDCGCRGVLREGIILNPEAAKPAAPAPAGNALQTAQEPQGSRGEEPSTPAPLAPGDRVWDSLTGEGPFVLVQPQEEGIKTDALQPGDPRAVAQKGGLLASVKVEFAWLVATPEGFKILPEAQITRLEPVKRARRASRASILLAVSLAAAATTAGVCFARAFGPTLIAGVGALLRHGR